MRPLILLAPLTLLTPAALQAQWALQNSHTTADLRGIESLGDGVAWASGSNGTVLRTKDAGTTWQRCATPPDAEKLDFRGVQAFDKDTAIVMSSGKGDLSRLYQTTDGCQTWKLVATNPDAEGFWDALIMRDKVDGWLLGDPVRGSFVLHRIIMVSGLAKIADLPQPADVPQQLSAHGRGAFAASNSSLAVPSGLFRSPHPGTKRPTSNCTGSDLWFGTSGPNGAVIFRRQYLAPQCADMFIGPKWISTGTPMSGSNASSGLFSIADEDGERLVAVGGDYLQSDKGQGTAAYTDDGGKHWVPAVSPPHGYRSAVAYMQALDTWITVGPNGTDISTDDGRNWHPLKPNPAAGDLPDADGHWNALSLPFVVGPGGRIGTLRPEALKPVMSTPQ